MPDPIPTYAQVMAVLDDWDAHPKQQYVTGPKMTALLRQYINHLTGSGTFTPATFQQQFVNFTTTYPARFSSIQVELFVDQVDGNDGNTGLSSGLPIKSFERVQQIINGKFSSVAINVLSDYTFSSTVLLRCPEIFIRTYGKNWLFKKRDLIFGATNYGQGSYYLGLYCLDAYINGRGTDGTTLGKIESEAHSGMLISGPNYSNGQGAIRLGGNYDSWTNGSYGLTVDAVTLKAGANSILLCGSLAGTASAYVRRSSLFKVAATETAEAGAKVDYGFYGDDTLLRNYTPTSATDGNVRETEMVQDANFLYMKLGGTIKKIAKSTF